MKFFFLNCLFAALLFSGSKAQTIVYEPKAAPASMVISGQARFTILSPQLIRMEWNERGKFEDRASLSFLNRNLPLTPFKTKENGKWLSIQTSCLKLYYKTGSGKFSSDNLYITFEKSNTRWYPGLKDSLNLKGTTRTLDNTDGKEDAIRLEDGIISRSGWAVVDDSDVLLFDGANDWNWVSPRPSEAKQDLYFFGYGHDYKKALLDYTLIAGKIPMPPRFAFGYWWSRYWTYSDSELRNLVKDFKTFNVPVDVLVIDMDWHNTWGLDHKWTKDEFGQSIGWTGYTWNKNLFPEPEKFIGWVHSRGLKTALNLHPASGIAPMEDQYEGFAKAYGFDTSSRANIPFKIEDKKWAKVYVDSVLHPLEKQGVDFWWLDWQQWLENKSLKGLGNTWWLNYVFYSDKQKQGKDRPLLFHRWGGLGNHRYPVGFSGDTYSTWSSLAYQPYFTATAGNVGYGYWSHDIGGHIAADPDPELYLRWIQYGVFSPILRTHSAKSAFNERRIWKFPSHYKSMLNAFQLRYALNPYIYTASREAYDTGLSLCRPMYYDHPEKSEAYKFKGQYMFGNDMLVAPITAKADTLTGLASAKIWLPKGQWFDYFSGAMITGDQVIDRKYTLDQVPVFVKAGSIIPMYPELKNLQGKFDTLSLAVIPGASGEAKVYEDDGKTDDYTKGEFAVSHITKQTDQKGLITLTISASRGNYEDMSSKRSYEVQFLSSFPPEEVSVNGKRIPYSIGKTAGTWTYTGEHLRTIVNIPATSRSQKIEVTLKPAKNSLGKEELLYKASGVFSQLAQSVELMKYESARVDWVANVSDCLLKLSATPSLIQYHPQKTLTLLETFNKDLLPCLRSLQADQRYKKDVLKKVIDPLLKDL